MQNEDRKAAHTQPVILFADDDEFCLGVVVKMFNRLGYPVLEARDGHEAIEVFKKNQNRIDLVFDHAIDAVVYGCVMRQSDHLPAHGFPYFNAAQHTSRFNQRHAVIFIIPG